MVTFGAPGHEEYVYCGCKSLLFATIVSTSQVRKLINSGCIAFLATVVDDRKGSPTLENISIVQEFSDVFLAELPKMPSDREIEFAINLLLGTVSISNAAYRMALVEMKKLKA